MRPRVLWQRAAALLFVAMALVSCGGTQDHVAQVQAKKLGGVSGSAGVLAAAVTGLSKVSETRVGRTSYEYVFKVTVKNTGGAYRGVVATITGVGTGTMVIDGTVSIGELATGATVTASDTITLRHDRSFPFDTAALAWTFTGTPQTGDDTATALITPAGGTLVLSDGAKVVIPAGALSASVNITLRSLAAPPPATLPPGQTLAGKVYSLEPDGQGFAQPATLTMPYDPASLSAGHDPNAIAIALLLPNSRFAIVGGGADPEAEAPVHVVDTIAHTVSVPIMGFSSYGAVAVNSASNFVTVRETAGTATVDIRRPTATGGMRTDRPFFKDCKNTLGNTDASQLPLVNRASTTRIVIHSTNSGNPNQPFDNALGWATSECTLAFAHYYLDRRGGIYQVADDALRVEHAQNANPNSVGIELFNNTGEPYDGRQIAALARLVNYLSAKYAIALPNRDAATGILTRTASDSIVTHHELHSSKCDPIGTFRNASQLQTAKLVGGAAVCEPLVAIGAMRIPQQPGKPSPSLMDAVVDTAIAMRDAARHTGIINSAGGDSNGVNAPGQGGPVTLAEDSAVVDGRIAPADLTQPAQNKMLFVAVGDTHSLAQGLNAFTDVMIAGTLIVQGPAELRVSGTLYVAQTGRILASDANGVDGGDLVVITRGSPVLLGLVDARGRHGAVAGQRGGRGGLIDIRSSALQNSLVPTVLTRGGNATSSAVPLTGTGGDGGKITLYAGAAHLYIGGGAGGTPGPWFRSDFPGGKTPPDYIGFELPPPAPFNMSSGGATPMAGVRTPLVRHAPQPGFTRGLLTSGGMGAFGSPAGAGGKGGDIVIGGHANAHVTFRDIDIATGADIEALHADITLRDTQQHRYRAATGSLGGKGTVTGPVRDGGAGGAAGAVTLAGPQLIPVNGAAASLAAIMGFGQPGGQLAPLTFDRETDPAFAIGRTVQMFDKSGNKLYRLRLDSAGTGLAGGSGGIPGGSPFVFPGRFGLQGASGPLTGLPR